MTVLPDRHALEWPSAGPPRFIHATATEHGWQIVTKARRMHEYPGPRSMAVW